MVHWFIGKVTRNTDYDWLSDRICSIRPLTDETGRMISDVKTSPFGGDLYLHNGQDLSNGQIVLVKNYRESTGAVRSTHPFATQYSDIEILNSHLVLDMIVVPDDILAQLAEGNGKYSIDTIYMKRNLPEKNILLKNSKALFGFFDTGNVPGAIVISSQQTWSILILDLDQVKIPIHVFQDEVDKPRTVVWQEHYDELLNIVQTQGRHFLTVPQQVLKDTLNSLPSNAVLEILHSHSEIYRQMRERLIHDIVEPEMERLALREQELNISKQEHSKKIALADAVLSLQVEEESNKSKWPAIEEWHDEKDLLDHISKFAKAEGYVFERDLIANFYTCLKTGYLTILAGISGSGKSKLPQLFARSIGAECKLVPVKPNWHDNRDLLGFYNPILQIYQATSMLHALIEANHEINERLWLIILDEMNLAPVEHYFADFLSLLEQGATPEIPLDGWDQSTWKQTHRHWIEKDDEIKLNITNKFKPPIRISQNVRFVGTINIDHTTQPLSDKVLDRANVIQFETANLKELSVTDRILNKGSVLQSPKRLLPQKFAEFSDRERVSPEMVAKIEPFSRHIYDTNTILRDAGLNFGFRVMTQIEDYLLHVANGREYWNLNQAYDYQIIQRILPKIRGVNVNNNKLATALGKLEDHVKAYPITHGKVQKMRQQLENGYVNYWEVI